MNESPNPFETPETVQDCIDMHFSFRGLEEQCRRSLELIRLSQDYMRTLLQSGDAALPALRQSLDDMVVAADRLDRSMRSLTALLHCIQHTTAPRWESVDLCACLRVICEEKDTFQQKLGIELTLDAGGLDELYVQADPRYLWDICLHLLSNALRACTPGGGRILITLRPLGRNGACLTIADTGCGLPGSSPASRQANHQHFLGGDHAGLVLCREYCRLSGWTLELRPRRGGGAQAVLTLPPREVINLHPVLRSVDEMERRRIVRRLWYDLVDELRCVPGLELTNFALPANCS